MTQKIISFCDNLGVLTSGTRSAQHNILGVSRNLAVMRGAGGMSNWVRACSSSSCCLRIAPRCDVSCANITSLTGQVLPCTNVIRYLGIFTVQSKTFNCSIDEAKRSFYRAANAIFGKIGRFASE